MDGASPVHSSRPRQSGGVSAGYPRNRLPHTAPGGHTMTMQQPRFQPFTPASLAIAMTAPAAAALACAPAKPPSEFQLIGGGFAPGGTLAHGCRGQSVRRGVDRGPGAVPAAALSSAYSRTSKDGGHRNVVAGASGLRCGFRDTDDTNQCGTAFTADRRARVQTVLSPMPAQ
jgi:hypothetical protein